jgi:hypothetical protein
MILGAACMGLAGAPAEASRIHHHVARGDRDLLAWESFINRGPQFWSAVHAPEISASVRAAMRRAVASVNPTSSPWVEYLLWRHNLAPARFDHWHPRLGPELERLLPPPTSQTSTAHRPPVTPTPPQGQNIHNPGVPPLINPPPIAEHNPPPITTNPPPAVPEPNPLAISAVLIASGLWWRWRTGRPQL